MWCAQRASFFVRSAPETILASPLRKKCLSYSWVLRSLVRIGERGERERGRGVWRFFGWLVAAAGRFGRGVRPSSVACPCCLSRALPFWFPPLAAVFPKFAYVGFSCSTLARLLVAPGRPLAFPRVLFLSLCYFYFNMTTRYKQAYRAFCFSSLGEIFSFSDSTTRAIA